MKTSDTIKYYLKARTPEGLRFLMVQNSTKANKYYGYDIIFANGFWYAWFEDSTDREMLTDDTINGHKGQRVQEV
jgi:hypothetical protein